MPRIESRGLFIAKAAAVVALALGLGFFAGTRRAAVQPQAEATERLADTAAVIVAVRGLSRLESVSFHIERIIDLKSRQPRLFGLVDADDEILLVAAGDAVAGIDLAKMRDGDIVAEPIERRVRLRLPPPELLSVRLDNERTYVHTRKTDLLARRVEEIETRARRLAESSIREAALSAGILERAKQSGEHTLTALVRSLGYDHVTVTWSEP